jgi:hypothetical protein
LASLQYGASPDRNEYDIPVVLAAFDSNLEAVELFHNHGADINKESKDPMDSLVI